MLIDGYSKSFTAVVCVCVVTQAARDACQNMAVRLEHIGSTKEEFNRQYGYKPVDKYDLLRNSPLG